MLSVLGPVDATLDFCLQPETFPVFVKWLRTEFQGRTGMALTLTDTDLRESLKNARIMINTATTILENGSK